MFGHFIITNHALERYIERVGYKKTDVMKHIKNDLHFTKITRIINNGNTRHVFTRNSKEFIFINNHGKWILKTVIKRNRETHKEAINHRRIACA